jgi:hypothetical protein
MKSYLAASLLFAMPAAAMVPGVNGWSKSLASANGAYACASLRALSNDPSFWSYQQCIRASFFAKLRLLHSSKHRVHVLK